MRTKEIGNAEVNYPDETVAVFARNPITVKGYTGTGVEMTITDGDREITDKRSLFGNGCFFDLTYYMTVMYDIKHGNVDYGSISDSGMAKVFTVTMHFLNGSTVENTFSFDVLGVWGAVMGSVNESLVMFDGYPFTVGVLSTSTIDRLRVNGEETVLGAVGAFNVPVTDDSTVELMRLAGSVHMVYKYIKVKKQCGSGIYLRWVDRSGVYRYWLFKQGDVTTKTENGQSFSRSNMGFGEGIERMSKKVGSSVEVCAPLVDGDTFAFLLECASSPLVDMYSDGEWVPVNVESGSIVREREALQDFIVTIVLPDTTVQEL